MISRAHIHRGRNGAGGRIQEFVAYPRNLSLSGMGHLCLRVAAHSDATSLTAFLDQHFRDSFDEFNVMLVLPCAAYTEIEIHYSLSDRSEVIPAASGCCLSTLYFDPAAGSKCPGFVPVGSADDE